MGTSCSRAGRVCTVAVSSSRQVQVHAWLKLFGLNVINKVSRIKSDKRSQGERKSRKDRREREGNWR